MSAPKLKKPRTKPPRNRPASTSAIFQPAGETVSAISSAFSPDGTLFALVSLAVDKHRLRVYDASTTSGKSVAEYVVEAARVSSLSWGSLSGVKADAGLEEAGPSKKRRKRESKPEATPSPAPVVLLGLTNGSVECFSPSHARVVRTLRHVSSTTAILSISTPPTSESSHYLWTSSADGLVRHWDTLKNEVVGSWRSDDTSPYSCISLRPGLSPNAEDETEEEAELVVANHSIKLVALSPDILTSSIDADTLASFTGHATPVTALKWDVSPVTSTRFASCAETDRFVHVWQLPPEDADDPTAWDSLVASVPLESDVRRIEMGSSTLLALSAGGILGVYRVDGQAVQPPPSAKVTSKVPTLRPHCTVTITRKKSDTHASQLVDVTFLPGKSGQVRLVRLVGGVRPVFHDVEYLDSAGQYIPDISITPDDAALFSASELTASNKRYAEPTSVAVRSGLELGQAPEHDNLPLSAMDGVLDTELAELTLGERLTALEGQPARPISPSSASSASSSDRQAAVESPTKRSRRSKNGNVAATGAELVPAASLTRTLIQALHSSDARLLETCLSHSDPALIRSTVRKLPPQLAVPLLDACVERLGRGARGANQKGGGGGASAQRGAGLVKWVKAVLAAHAGHLMTIPDLVARLAGLHATLTARLAVQQSMLELSGKLDLVLTQIEMRSALAPASIGGAKQNGKTGEKGPITRYVEGESESDSEGEAEAEADGMEVEVEVGSDAGSVEDVQLGGSEEGDDDEFLSAGLEDDDEDEDEDEDEDGPHVNGFIDDEAEEFSGEDSEEGSE